MGPTMLPLHFFPINIPGRIASVERCAVPPPMFGQRVFQTARLHFPENTKTFKIANIMTGHHFCKTPPAGRIIFGTVNY